MNAPLAVCEKRDVKGLYQRARANQIQDFTGISSAYEPPESPDLEVRTDVFAVDLQVRLNDPVVPVMALALKKEGVGPGTPLFVRI